MRVKLVFTIENTKQRVRMRNCILSILIATLACFRVPGEVSTAFAASSTVDSQKPVIAFFMFPDQDIRQALTVVDKDKTFSKIRPKKFSEADLVVYILEDWPSARSIQGAEVLGPVVLEHLAKLKPQTILHLAEFDKAAGNKLKFYFINARGLPSNVGWLCLARFLVFITEADLEIDSFSFENCQGN